MSTESSAVKPPIPLWRRVRVWVVTCVLYCIVLSLAGGGFVVLRHAFVHGIDITNRIYRLLGGAALLGLPALVARQFILRKRATGRWGGTREYNRQRIGQCAMRPQRCITPKQRSLALLVLHWANIALRNPQSSLFKRALGIVVFVIYLATLLAICALSVIFIVGGVYTFTSMGWIMVLFGLILLFIPIQFVAGIIHRRQTQGDLRSSDEDVVGIMAARGAWWNQQRQQPLRAKLISTAVSLSVVTLFWLRVIKHPGQGWTIALLWTPYLAYVIWNQFRKPKTSPTS